MNAVQRGFTLIELMIVVAIVGILAAIALPAYQDYMVRAKMSEPLAKLDELKLSIAEYIASNNVIPANGTEAGLGGSGIVAAGSAATPAPTAKYYNAVAIDASSATVTPPLIRVGVRMNGTANSILNNVWLHMEGTVDSPGSTAVVWDCRVDTVGSSDATKVNKYLPSSCRTQVTFTAS